MAKLPIEIFVELTAYAKDPDSPDEPMKISKPVMFKFEVEREEFKEGDTVRPVGDVAPTP